VEDILNEKKYQFLNHVSDAYLQAFGKSLNETFENAALGFTATVVSIDKIRPKIFKRFKVKGIDRLHLLYNWLELLLLELTIKSNIFNEFSVNIVENGSLELTATARGESLKPKIHQPEVEIKAVTYHLMEVIEEKNQFIIKFLLDL
tara:strand:- start:2767 stop:3207 length:441 start_codon:yes stop_codon:yes gene_type:complete